jgi:hypothetical protein
MRNSVIIAFLIAVLIILAGMAIGLVYTVRQTTQPVAALSSDLSTQVASFLNPTPTILPDPVTIVREIRALARLETIQYSLEKVITAETRQEPFGFLFGDKLLLVAHGVVIAGVDLAKLGPQDVWVDNLGRVYIRLPEPEVFIATLDNDKSYIYDRQIGLLTKGEIELESLARRAAEDEIETAALEDGILDQARINAENYIFSLMRALGFQDIIFVGAEETPSFLNTSTPSPLVTPTGEG